MLKVMWEFCDSDVSRGSLGGFLETVFEFWLAKEYWPGTPEQGLKTCL